jgi:hypothetical protein
MGQGDHALRRVMCAYDAYAQSLFQDQLRRTECDLTRN